MDGVPRSILSRRNGEGALGTMFLGNGEALQRSWAVAVPWPNAVDGGGLLLWRVPELVIDPRRLGAGVLGHSPDGYGARGTRVHQQRAQALALAPSPCLPCLDDPPLQGAYPTMAGCPVHPVPCESRQV